MSTPIIAEQDGGYCAREEITPTPTEESTPSPALIISPTDTPTPLPTVTQTVTPTVEATVVPIPTIELTATMPPLPTLVEDSFVDVMMLPETGVGESRNDFALFTTGFIVTGIIILACVITIWVNRK